MGVYGVRVYVYVTLSNLQSGMHVQLLNTVPLSVSVDAAQPA